MASKIVWKSEKKNVVDLIEWDKNPRVITKEGLSDLKKSITKFGIAEPLVINLDNTICGGHGRKMAMIELGISEVDCYIPNRLLSEKEFEELNVRLNKNVAGQWDFDKLANEFEFDDLLEWGFSADELGVPEIEKLVPQCDEDEVPEVKDTITKRGDVWLLGAYYECEKCTKRYEIEQGNKLNKECPCDM